MPKAPRTRLPPRNPIPSGPCSNSTRNRRARAVLIKESGADMGFRCERCEKENLQCLVDTSTGECAGCHAVHAACSLFVPESKWEAVQAEKRKKRLALLRAEEEAARLRREIAEAEELEHSYADRDLAILAVQDKLQEKGETDNNSAPGSGRPEPSIPSPLADPGWSQAEFDFSCLSSVSWSASDLEFFFPDTSGGTPVPVPCSP